MNLEIKKSRKENFSQAELWNFWNRKYKIFFGIISIFVLGIGVFIWYKSFYAPAWNDQEREAYRITKDSGINFKEKDFNSALSIVEERRIEYERQQEEVIDIFKKY